MKYVLYFIVATSVLVSSCSKNDQDIETKDLTAKYKPIFGKWKQVGAFISSGGPQYWVDVDNGEELTFSSDGGFSSNRFSGCTNGDFEIESDELKLSYNCDGFESGFENSEGFITYIITFESDYFLITPTSGAICTDGCSYKYIRI